MRLSKFSKGETPLEDRAVGTNCNSGDIAHSTLFACGDLEGSVHIWDLRNVKRPATQVSPPIRLLLTRVLTYPTGQVLSYQDQERHLARVAHPSVFR